MESVQEKSDDVTDWTQCCLSQTGKHDYITTPGIQGMSSLEKDLKDFELLGDVSLSIKLQRLNDGSGIANTCLTNKAMWHKKCHNICNQQKVQRVRNILSKTKQKMI